MNVREFLVKHPVINRLIRIICLMIVGLIIAHIAMAERNVFWQDAGFTAMSTWASVRFYVADKNSTGPAVRLVQKVFYEVSDRCNVFLPESELARLNASAYRKPFRCSPELWTLLTEARKWHQKSGGAFDITVGPLMKLWGFRSKERHLPTPEEIAEAKKKVGLDKVVFDDADRTVKFTVDGMALDLGGIAKGAALDLAAERAETASFVGMERAEDVPFLTRADAWFKRKMTKLNRGFIDLGGNVMALKDPPPGEPNYRAGIRNFAAPRGMPCAYIRILGECISTSGSYERFVTLNGHRYSHIIDPVSGMPVENMLSVTVVAKRGIDADALSTAIFVKGKDFAEQMKREMPDLRVLMYYSRPESPDKVEVFALGDGWEGVTVPVLPPSSSAASAARPAPVLSPAPAAVPAASSAASTASAASVSGSSGGSGASGNH